MADIKGWPNGVNKIIRRSETSWQSPIRFIEDETKSGKRKRRLHSTFSKKTYSIKMLFTETEYHIFEAWYNNTLSGGLYPFYFPTVDSSAKKTNTAYKITSDGAPQYSNDSGKYLSCTMKWEEA